MKNNKNKKNKVFAEIEIKYKIGKKRGLIVIDSETFQKKELAVGVDNDQAYFELPLSEAYLMSVLLQEAIKLYRAKDIIF